MPLRPPLVAINASQLRAATFATVREALRPLSAALMAMFFLITSAHFWFEYDPDNIVLLVIESSSAITMLVIYVALRRRRVPDQLVYPVLFLVAAIALANTAAQLYISKLPQDSTNFAVIIIGTALVSLSTGLSTLIVAIAWGCWLYVAAVVHPPGDWIHYGFVLSWATALAIVVQTVRRRLLARLVQAETRHQMLIEHLPMISYIDEAQIGGRTIYISPQVEQILGFSPEEWLSRPDFWIDQLYPADREITLTTLRSHLLEQTAWELEYRMVAANGHVLWLQNRSTRFVEGPGQQPLAYGIVIDITERKRAEALKSGATRVFEKLAEGAPLDDVLRVLLKASEDIHPGVVGSVLLLEDTNRLRYLTAPSLPDYFLAATDGLPIGPDTWTCGVAAFMRQRMFVDDLAAHPAWTPYRDVALRAGLRACWSEPILSSTGSVLGTLTMYYRQTVAPRPIDEQLIQTAARLAGLTIERLRTAADLVSYREQLEELVAERTQQLETSLEQLRHSERLAAVGTLAAGIAHEINNPLGLIMLSAEQVLQQMAESNEQRMIAPYLQEIVANTRRCGQIVKSVLRFARRNEPAEHCPSDINVVVRSSVALTRPYAAHLNCVVDVQLHPGPPSVLLNVVELEQVFVNLIRNAIESAGTPPRVSIATEVVGSRVRITVRDNGPGVSDEDRSRIFDPFYTTRQAAGGTGLGLSLAYGIISDHGGTIQVGKVTSGGTTMIVELPAHETESSA